MSGSSRALEVVTTSSPAVLTEPEDLAAYSEHARLAAQYARKVLHSVPKANAATAAGLCAELLMVPVVRAGQKDGTIETAGSNQFTRLSESGQPPRTFAELGIDRRRFDEAALMVEEAGFTVDTIAERQADKDAKGQYLSRGAVLSAARADVHRATAARLRAHGITLPDGEFATIELDPPWSYEERGLAAGGTGRGVEHQYPTMSLAEIADLPISEMAADGCHLYLWATNTHLRDTFGLVDSWGFAFKTLLTWVKPRIGLGSHFRNNTEHVVFAVRGTLPLLRRDVPTGHAWPIGRHSQKPDAFYALVEECSPGPRVRLFARDARDGWESWGNEL